MTIGFALFGGVVFGKDLETPYRILLALLATAVAPVIFMAQLKLDSSMYTFQTSYFPPFMVIAYVLVIHSLNCLSTALSDLVEEARDLKVKCYSEKKAYIEEVHKMSSNFNENISSL